LINPVFMIQPEPHNFSQSPVAEVLCRWEFESGSLITLSIPGPYPGWRSIQGDIRRVIAGIIQTKGVVSCMLRYTDEFAFEAGEKDPSAYSSTIAPDAEAWQKAADTPKFSAGVEIRTDHERKVFEYVFTIQTDTAWFATEEEIVDWYDAAHAEIHNLFDKVVPSELIRKLQRVP
jgi:uncharacterized protein (TIGR04255 family)